MLLSNRVHLPTIFLSYSRSPKQKKIPFQYSVFKKHLYIMYYNPSLGTEPTGEKNSKLHVCLIVYRVWSREVAQVELGETKQEEKEPGRENIHQTRRERTRKSKMLQQQTNIGARCPIVPVIQSQNKQGAQMFKSQQEIGSYKSNGGSYFSRSSNFISAADHRRPNFKLAVNSNSYKIIGQNPSPHKLAVNNSYKVIGQNPSPVIYQSQNK